MSEALPYPGGIVPVSILALVVSSAEIASGRYC